MKVVILCGGQGTRLREETEFRPKALVTVGGLPIIWHIMKTYAHYGFRDFVLCLGYRGEMIREYFLNYDAMNNDFTICLGTRSEIIYHGAHNEDFRVTLADTGLQTMTGGRVRRIKRHIEDDIFMLTYGDGVSDVNIRSLVEFHRAHGKIATVTAVQPVSRYGMLDVDFSGLVRGFAEKPRVNAGWVSAGYFVFDRRLFDYLTDDDCVLEQAPLERLSAEGELVAFRHPGFFFAMDTYREYVALNGLWESGEAPWKVWA